MNVVTRCLLSLVLSAIAQAATATETECLTEEVQEHVRGQFALYGPKSANHEYFGFIYRYDGVIGSAVTQSEDCHSDQCVVDTAQAIRSIPKRATILGEWHTHPHDGSPSLSRQDVRGAYANRHINCYRAFYSTPSGAIYAWDPQRISVPIAMASRAPVGSYLPERS